MQFLPTVVVSLLLLYLFPLLSLLEQALLVPTESLAFLAKLGANIIVVFVLLQNLLVYLSLMLYFQFFFFFLTFSLLFYSLQYLSKFVTFLYHYLILLRRHFTSISFLQINFSLKLLNQWSFFQTASSFCLSKLLDKLLYCLTFLLHLLQFCYFH